MILVYPVFVLEHCFEFIFNVSFLKLRNVGQQKRQTHEFILLPWSKSFLTWQFRVKCTFCCINLLCKIYFLSSSTKVKFFGLTWCIFNLAFVHATSQEKPFALFSGWYLCGSCVYLTPYYILVYMFLILTKLWNQEQRPYQSLSLQHQKNLSHSSCLLYKRELKCYRIWAPSTPQCQQ